MSQAPPAAAPAPDNLKGALWALGAVAAATAMLSGIKGLAGVVPATQMVVARCLFDLAWILPLALVRLGPVWRTRHWRAHLIRGTLSAASINAGFHSTTVLPLTTSTVLFFTAPLFVTVLAVPMLGERVGWRRLAATAVGFAGAVVVMRPSPAGVDPGMLWALLSAGLFAVTLLMGKRLSAEDAPTTLMFYTTTLSLLATLPIATSAGVRPPEPWVVALLLVVACSGTIRTYCDIKSYATGEASAVAPFNYLRIVLIAVAGYAFFAEVPDGPTLIGAAMIVGSTLYIAQREARLRRQRSRAGDAAR